MNKFCICFPHNYVYDDLNTNIEHTYHYKTSHLVLCMYLYVVPTAPRSLTVNNTADTSVTLSWLEPDMANGIITAYQLEYRPVGGDQQFTISQNFTLLIGTVTGLSASTEYEFRVAAFTRVGPGPYSMTVVSFTTSKFYHILYICNYIYNAYTYVIP